MQHPEIVATTKHGAVATATRSPAKLLHITGRRADGYHTLWTAFEILTYYDDLVFSPRSDSIITLHCVRSCGPVLIDDAAIAALDGPDDLVLIAAYFFCTRFSIARGIDNVLCKRVPIGGGLGGGSADAATTLIALKRLWEVNAPSQELLPLGSRHWCYLECICLGAMESTLISN